jgi:hypothetical protein
MEIQNLEEVNTWMTEDVVSWLKDTGQDNIQNIIIGMIIMMYRLPFTVSLNTTRGKKVGAMMIMVSFLGSCISMTYLLQMNGSTFKGTCTLQLDCCHHSKFYHWHRKFVDAYWKSISKIRSL